MQSQPFNSREYADLKRRVEALRSRIDLDAGAEQEQAKRLLVKMEKKLQAYEHTYGIPKEEPKSKNTSTSKDFWDFFWDTIAHGTTPPSDDYQQSSWNPMDFEDNKTYQEDTRTVDELVKDLGILYAIFGSTYQTVLNYHVFKIRFQKHLKNDRGAFYRVSADIYEDDLRICKGINIGFWPARFGDDLCGDMEFSLPERECSEKYTNGCSIIYTKLLEGLKDMWNQYFTDKIPMLTGQVSNALEKSTNPQCHFMPNEREKIIEQIEKDIDTGRMKSFQEYAIKMAVGAYTPFSSLQEFLENSGVVYKVEKSGIYIWNLYHKRFGKLVGYEYHEDIRQYTLYLL